MVCKGRPSYPAWMEGLYVNSQSITKKEYEKRGWGETVTTYKTQTAFYIISIVLITTILSCFYGFGQMIKTGEKKRCKSLVLQSICAVAFFVLFGVTVGVFVGSFLLGKRKLPSVWVPSLVAPVDILVIVVSGGITAVIFTLLNGNCKSSWKEYTS